jgi:hypothetical protein
MCDHVFTVEIPERIDALTDAKVIPSIYDGTFLSFSCERCGKILKPEFQLSIHNLPGDHALFFIPEIDRNPYLSGRIEVPDVDRVVIGYRELVEKVQIFTDGLDDRAIEIAKSRLLRKAPEDTDTDAFFYGLEGPAAVFHIHGLKENEIGVARIPLEVIRHITEDIPTIITEEPARSILAGPYVSLRNIKFDLEVEE